MYCILVDHPYEGLVLWETGSGKDYPTVWGPVIADLCARVKYERRHGGKDTLFLKQKKKKKADG